MHKYQSLILIATVFSTALLSGCVSKSYEADVAEFRATQEQLNSTISAQQQQLAELHQKLDTMNQQSSVTERQLSQVIRSQDDTAQALPALARRICPPAPVAKCPEDTRISGKMVLGQVEYTWIAQADRHLPARIDSGAATSSINAQDQTVFERDGDKWARFALADPDSGELLYLEAPITRFVKITQSAADQPERRPVVSLKLGIGAKLLDTEFTLANRQAMDYQVLIGRTFLQDRAVVDVSRENFQPKYQVKESRVSRVKPAEQQGSAPAQSAEPAETNK